MLLRVNAGAAPIGSHLASEVCACHSARKSAAHNHHDLVFHVDAFVRIKVLRLDHPAIAGKHKRSGQCRRDRVRQEVFADNKIFSVNLRRCLGRVDRLAPQGDLLKESSLVAHGLKAPAAKIHRDEFRGRVQPARGCVASFHFIRRDERKIAAQQCRGYRVDAARFDNDYGCMRAGASRWALRKSRRQRERKRRQNDQRIEF